MTSTPQLIFGAGGYVISTTATRNQLTALFSIGGTEKSFIYTWDTPEKVSELFNVLKELGLSRLDSAASYPPGNPWNTDTLLGQTKAAERGFQIDTKILGRATDGHPLSRGNIETSITKSLELLGVPKLGLLYVHAPDANTPLEETAAAFHEQYVAGRFELLGLCNYSGDELKRYLAICEENGYIKPSVIQDEYNALVRRVEPEILPLCKQNNMAFHSYSPLAGGLLTGKVTFSKDKSDPKYQPLPDRTRWGGESKWQRYNDTFDHDYIHAAIRKLRAVCDDHDIGLAEACLRWLEYHSALGSSDGVILGATKEAQIRGNVEAISKGSLPAEVVSAVNQMNREAGQDLKMFG